MGPEDKQVCPVLTCGAWLLVGGAVKPLIKDTPKEDKPPNRGQAETTLVYTFYRKPPLKEDNLSILYEGQNGWSQRCPY